MEGFVYALADNGKWRKGNRKYMKRMLYLYCGNIHDDGKGDCALSGVNIKVKNHLKQFQNAGYKVQLKRLHSKADSWVNLFDLLGSKVSWDMVSSDVFYDVVYIRFARIDFEFIKLMTNLKKRNPKVKILLEIPTYPYKGEMNTLKLRALYIKDRIFSEFLRICIDRIVLSTPDYKKLFGVQTLYVPNSVDYTAIGAADYIVNDKKEIHLIAVSTMNFWHGYDRLINGMAEYYKDDAAYKVVLHLVGDGEVCQEYRKMVQENGLEEFVIFEGPKKGMELDAVYDNCVIGIGSLGIHRIDKKLKASTLKLKEYACRGLPVVTAGYTDAYNEKTKQYILKIEDDESDIDVDRIVKFYNNLYGEDNTIRETIRETFRPYCDMEKVFKPVIDYLK